MSNQSKDLREQTVLDKESYNDIEEERALNDAILNKQVAVFKRHLKTLSKNTLIRIVVENSITLLALREKLKNLNDNLLVKKEENK